VQRGPRSKYGGLCMVSFGITHDLAAPGKGIDAFAAGEHMAEMRLIAEPAFQTDLRQAQVGVPDQQLGPRKALGANPVLRRQSGAAFEGAGKMTARQRTGAGQFGNLKAFAEAFKDQLFDLPFALRTESADPGLAWIVSRGEGDVVL